MSTITRPHPQPAPASGDDPYRLGWRYVPRELPDGTVHYEQVPLTEEDVLHPQEEDFIVNTGAHEVDGRYLQDVFRTRLADSPELLTLHDHRVDWGVPEPKPHGPDIVVFDHVQSYDPEVGTFYVKEQGAKPLLVIEVTSPSTRANDIGIKVRHYHMVRVPLYIIVDRDHPEGLRLVAYQYRPRAYVPLPLEDGRVWIEALGLWLGLKEDRVVCYDGVTNEELGNYTAIALALQEMKARADAEYARAEAEKARADREAQARADLEARLRQLEAQIQARNGEPGGASGSPS